MRTLALSTISLIALSMGPLVASGDSDTVNRLQTVPNADTENDSGLIQGDVWQFKGSKRQKVTIEVDNRDDNGDNTSNLDPVLVLKRPDGSVHAFEDDNDECGSSGGVPLTQVCGFACPKITTTLDTEGTWSIVVRDFNEATGVQCTGGAYHLKFRAPKAARNSLRFSLDDGAVGDPPDLQTQLESNK
jgi:hypothetical protein